MTVSSRRVMADTGASATRANAHHIRRTPCLETVSAKVGQEGIPIISLTCLRRLPGTLLLLLLAFGLFVARPAWAEGNDAETGNVLVRVSPLTLLLENEVTIKVGEFTCHLVNGVDPSSQCANLPPGEYEVRALSEVYFTMPSSYPLTIPSENDEEDARDTLEAASAESEFLFKFYQIRNEMYMPSLQVEP